MTPQWVISTADFIFLDDNFQTRKFFFSRLNFTRETKGKKEQLPPPLSCHNAYSTNYQMVGNLSISRSATFDMWSKVVTVP